MKWETKAEVLRFVLKHKNYKYGKDSTGELDTIESYIEKYETEETGVENSGDGFTIADGSVWSLDFIGGLYGREINLFTETEAEEYLEERRSRR